MRRLTFLLLAAFLATSGYTQNSYPLSVGQDIIHYDFQININDSTNQIQGFTVLQLTSNRADSIYLDLVNIDAAGNGMEVIGISSNDIEIPYKHNNDRLRIPLSEVALVKNRLELSIAYTGIPLNGLIIGKNKFGYRTFFGDNYPDRARNWLPCVDHPADKATVTWQITAPQKYKVIASGAFVSEYDISDGTRLTIWDEQVPISTKVMVFGAANFAVNQAGIVNDVPVSTWVYKENYVEGFKDFNIAPRILAFFDSLVGDYSYEKLANVQSKTMYGGMENASNIFYFEDAVNGKEERESLIAHEIAHQWFGNSATEKDWQHAWLSEGFATYMTHIYTELKYGKEELNKGMVADREKVIKYWHSTPLPVVNTELVSYPKIASLRELLSTNTYDKGGWVLHMLRNELGDEVFFKTIRTYYTTFRNSNADTEDFKKVVSEVSGRNVDQFFQQWLYGMGQPRLEGTWKYSRKQLTLEVNQTQKGEFNFPLEVALVYDDKTVLKQLSFDATKASLSLEIEKPNQIILDPNTKLLFEGEPVLKYVK